MSVDVIRRAAKSAVDAFKGKEYRIFILTTISAAAIAAAISAIYYSLFAFPKISPIELAIVVLAAISISAILTTRAILWIRRTLKALGVPDDVVGDISTGALLTMASTSALFAQGVMASNVVDAITGVAAGAAILIFYYLFTVLLIRPRISSVRG